MGYNRCVTETIRSEDKCAFNTGYCCVSDAVLILRINMHWILVNDVCQVWCWCWGLRINMHQILFNDVCQEWCWCWGLRINMHLILFSGVYQVWCWCWSLNTNMHSILFSGVYQLWCWADVWECTWFGYWWYELDMVLLLRSKDKHRLDIN